MQEGVGISQRLLARPLPLRTPALTTLRGYGSDKTRYTAQDEVGEGECADNELEEDD